MNINDVLIRVLKKDEQTSDSEQILHRNEKEEKHPQEIMAHEARDWEYAEKLQNKSEHRVEIQLREVRDREIAEKMQKKWEEEEHGLERGEKFWDSKREEKYALEVRDREIAEKFQKEEDEQWHSDELKKIAKETKDRKLELERLRVAEERIAQLKPVRIYTTSQSPFEVPNIPRHIKSIVTRVSDPAFDAHNPVTISGNDTGNAEPTTSSKYIDSILVLSTTWSLHLGITTCWIAAEHALLHARNNISSVSEVFDRWKIQKSEYIVLAGFDESLINSRIGYLEQIHVFVIAEIDATSPLLSELGRLFSPFSSILFTESCSYRLPVFKDDGSVWEFDELVYFTATKFADGGSSAETPLTIISLSQTHSPVTTGISQSSSGSPGDDKGEENKRLEKGKGRDTGDNKGDEGESDDPDDPGPPGNRDGIVSRPAEIFFDIASEIHPFQDTSESIQDENIFQPLAMHGSLTIKVLLSSYCYGVTAFKLCLIDSDSTCRRHHSA